MKYVAVAAWDGEKWDISVPNYGGTGRANTSARTLAEAAPNASVVLGVLGSNPDQLLAAIGVEVQLPPLVAEPCQVAAGLIADVTAELRDLGLTEADIATILGGHASTIATDQSPANPVCAGHSGREDP